MKYLVCMGIIIVGFLIITMILAIYCSMNMNKLETQSDNDEDVLLYDQDKVTLDDCIIMDKCYGKKAVINDGKVLGFK